MSRPGAWRVAWNNFVNSITKKKFKQKIYVGEDVHGNRFYEYEHTKSNVKRGYEPPQNNKHAQLPSTEWKAWLLMTRRFPPTDEEILINQSNMQTIKNEEIISDAKTERKAPKIDSKGKGAADIDRNINFPIYKDIEVAAGVKPSSEQFSKPQTNKEKEKIKNEFEWKKT